MLKAPCADLWFEANPFRLLSMSSIQPNLQPALMYLPSPDDRDLGVGSNLLHGLVTTNASEQVKRLAAAITFIASGVVLFMVGLLSLS